jgi:hypothetical protein
MAILGLLVNGQAQLFADGLGLQHHGADKTPHQVVVQDAVGGGTRPGADGVDGEVAPQLEPDALLDAVGPLHIDAAARQRAGQGLQSLAEPAPDGVRPVNACFHG